MKNNQKPIITPLAILKEKAITARYRAIDAKTIYLLKPTTRNLEAMREALDKLAELVEEMKQIAGTNHHD